MSDVYAIRLANLRRLIDQLGGPTALSHKLKYANGSYISQLAGPTPTRQIGEKVARQIEERLGIEAGWLDREGATMTFGKKGNALVELREGVANQPPVVQSIEAMRALEEQSNQIMEELARQQKAGGDFVTRAIEKVVGDRVLRERVVGGNALHQAPVAPAGLSEPKREFHWGEAQEPGPRDLPVYGAFRGGFDGSEINYHDPVEMIERPPELLGVVKACALYIVNDSMEPRYHQGEQALVHPGRPVKMGDYVAVELVNGHGLIKRLLRRTDDFIELEQLNPPEKRKFARREIAGIYKIIGTRTG